jgi:hypothetical protein
VLLVRITAREFIRLWQTSNSVAEVAMKTRTKKNAVPVRAYRYRKLGIPLKEFPYVEAEANGLSSFPNGINAQPCGHASRQ